MQPDVKFFFTSLSRCICITADVACSLRPEALRSRDYKHGRVAVQACKDLSLCSVGAQQYAENGWLGERLPAENDNTLQGQFVWFQACDRIEFQLA